MSIRLVEVHCILSGQAVHESVIPDEPNGSIESLTRRSILADGVALMHRYIDVLKPHCTSISIH